MSDFDGCHRFKPTFFDLLAQNCPYKTAKNWGFLARMKVEATNPEPRLSINMRLNFLIKAAFCAVACSSLFSNILLATDTSISELNRAGLKSEWFTQLEVGSRSQIVNMQLQVNEDKSTRYFLVEYDGTVERISQFDLNAFGKEYGIEGAEAHAAVRKEIVMAELAAQKRNVEVTVRPITLPQSTIYAVTSAGIVTAVDADTGRHIWKSQVGNPKYLTSGIGSSKTHVAIANGSTLYCLNAENGKTLWSRTCRRAPSAPPSVGEENVFVPLIDGRLEVFALDGGGLPRSYVSFGKSVAKPLVTDETVSWATTDGFYAIAPFRSKSIKFRLNSGSKLASGGASGVETLFVNTTEGSIFAIHEKFGSILWEYATGDRISEAPFVREGFVYSISDENRLYKIDISNGLPCLGWEKPLDGVSKFVGMAGDRIYLLNNIGRLIAIDHNTGDRVASIGGSEITLVLPNHQTDRLYIGTKKGLLRCYRESANTYPVFHANDGEMLVENANKAAGEEKGKKPAESADDEDDPFAAESDPFASGDEEEDPFGSSDDDGEEDPFGSSDDSSSEEEDPFGGGNEEEEDPFGGGSEEEEDPFGGV